MDADRSLLIFVPTYNEAENVESLYNQICELTLERAQILFLDDNSPDGTGRIIDRLASTDPRVHVIHRACKQGIGSAHAVGIRWAYQHGFACLVTMDCDFTHSPYRIPDFLACGADNDVVIGSRYLKEGSLRTWNFFRRALTRVGHLLTTRLLGMPYDATGAFRVYRLDRIPEGIFDLVSSNSYSFFFESLYVLWLNGCQVKEIPLELPSRTYGHSKMSWKDVLRSTFLLFYLFTKTRMDSRALLYAEPFHSSVPDAPGPVQVEWDTYWSVRHRPAQLIYDVVAMFYRRVIIRRIVNYFITKYFSDGAHLLHAGCGSGQVDIDIGTRVYISALDISPNALSLYRKFQPNVSRLIHASIFAVSAPDSSFDGVYNLGVMEHFTETEILQILKEFNRVLREGGKIVLFWPPVFGLTVGVLTALHWSMRRFGSQLQLHPPELTRVRSRKQVQAYLTAAGFSLIEFYFGPRDLFTHAVIIGQKVGSPLDPLPLSDSAVCATSSDSVTFD
jgi:dolichol-phosphate mannosyltransferase